MLLMLSWVFDYKSELHYYRHHGQFFGKMLMATTNLEKNYLVKTLVLRSIEQ